jgi:hypothetical protein
MPDYRTRFSLSSNIGKPSVISKEMEAISGNLMHKANKNNARNKEKAQQLCNELETISGTVITLLDGMKEECS